jgi:hypothetical protein
MFPSRSSLRHGHGGCGRTQAPGEAHPVSPPSDTFVISAGYPVVGMAAAAAIIAAWR